MSVFYENNRQTAQIKRSHITKTSVHQLYTKASCTVLLQLDTSGKALRLSRVSLGFWIVADNMLKGKLKAQQHEVNVHFLVLTLRFGDQFTIFISNSSSFLRVCVGISMWIEIIGTSTAFLAHTSARNACR